MPRISVLVDMFSGWTGTLCDRTEVTAEVAEALLREIVPKLGIPGSPQSGKCLVFVPQ